VLPVVIDTDPGVDDAVALWWALTSPTLDVVALTAVHGNIDVDLAAANALRIVHAAGRPEVPVAVGEAAAIGPAPVTAFPRWIHGEDGLGEVGLPPAPLEPVTEPAVELLRRVVDERPGEVAVVTLGPLSNVARVLAADPTWASRVGQLVVLAGSVAAGGNATAAAEANVAHDPDALAAVLAAAWPAPPLLIGLDATHVATLGPGELALCTERRTPAAAFCDAPLRFYGGVVAHPNGDVACHDLLAVLALEDPAIVDADERPVAVDTAGGPAWGATIVDRRRYGTPADGFARWRVALHADVARFRAAAGALFGAGARRPRG
jgi:inosine-uridine nucleoside N-ribohydrolase